MKPVLCILLNKKHDPCAANQYATREAIAAPTPPYRGIRTMLSSKFITPPAVTITKYILFRSMALRNAVLAISRLVKMFAQTSTISIRPALEYASP
jgi:hypothetical protein